MNNRLIPNEREESLQKYFKDVKNSQLITPDKEVELSKRIQDGDQQALNELVNANLKFVVSIAKDYQGQGLPLSDLISEGNLGLIRSAYKFDHTKGIRFITYAVWWIKQAIRQSLNDNSRTVRLPSNVIQKNSKLRKVVDKFELENGRVPMDGEIYDEHGDVVESINELYNSPSKVSISLNCRKVEDGDEIVDTFVCEELFKPEDIDDMTKIGRKLKETLKLLNDREYDIITSYFGYDVDSEPMTLEAIGEKYSLTKERVRQIKEKAIRKLRFNISELYDVMNE